jgi:hypothetical protein
MDAAATGRQVDAISFARRKNDLQRAGVLVLRRREYRAFAVGLNLAMSQL